MKIFPVDPERLFQVLAFVFVLEVTRLLLGYILGREKGREKFIEQRLIVLADLATIKSEQLEFVKKTKLERKQIAIEKEMEKLKSDYNENAPQWKRIFRIIRFIVYSVTALYFTSTPLVMVDKALFWPLAPFSSSCSIVLSVWSIIPLASFGIRHFLRVVAPLVTNEAFP